MEPITLLIADDHEISRQTWRKILDADPAVKVVATCAIRNEAIETEGRLCPQIFIMDINLPGITGIEATTIITRRQQVP